MYDKIGQPFLCPAIGKFQWCSTHGDNITGLMCPVKLKKERKKTIAYLQNLTERIATGVDNVE